MTVTSIPYLLLFIKKLEKFKVYEDMTTCME